MSNEIIAIEGLTKRYGSFTAVDQLTLSVKQGEVFGLLGPNGAGKTTTTLMLLGLTEPSEGRAMISGIDCTREPLKVKRIVGYLSDNMGFYPDMTGRENLRMTGRMNEMDDIPLESRIDALLEAVPFKVKKAMLIISDVIFMAFNVWISYIYVDKLIPTMGRGVTSLLRIPKKFLYAIIPVMLMVTCIRLVQNIIRLSKESPKELGASKPVIDIDALEAEARALKEKEGNN